MNFKEIQELMAQAQQRAQEMQGKMAQLILEASAGGGSVTVRMNGQKQLLSVVIDPEVIASRDREMLQDLIVAAVNECGRKADQAIQANLGSVLGGMNIPGLT